MKMALSVICTRVLLVLSLVLAGCDSMGDAGQGDGGATSIGPSGGTITSSGAELEIPEDALSESVTVDIETVSAPVDLPDTWQPLSNVIVITPHGLEFDRAAMVTLDYDDDGAVNPAVAVLNDESDDSWELLSDVQFADGQARFERNSLSYYVVVETESDDTGDDSCDERKTTADDEVARALDAYGSCDHSSDCTLSGRNRLASCEFHLCAVAVNVADVASFDARIDEIDAEYCKSFRAECDSPGGSVCGEQHDAAVCEAGRCVPTTSIPCAESSVAFTEILTEHDARACDNDNDCITLSDELDAALGSMDDYCTLAVSTTVDQETLTLAIQSLPVQADCPKVPCTAFVCPGGVMTPFVPRCIDNVCSNVQDPCP